MAQFVTLQSIILRKSEVILVNKTQRNSMRVKDADTIYDVVVLFSNGSKENIFHGRSDEVDEFIKDLCNKLN